MMTAERLGPMGMEAPESVRARLEEQRELMRRAAQSALDRSKGGKTMPAGDRNWARHWAAVKPLARPLTTGEPE